MAGVLGPAIGLLLMAQAGPPGALPPVVPSWRLAAASGRGEMEGGAAGLPSARLVGLAPERRPRAALQPDAAADGAAVVLPLPAGTGAAAFRRGDTEIVVFDAARALDVGALRAEPGFAGVQVQLLPHATVLRLAQPPDHVLALRHDGPNWSIGFAAETRLDDGALAPTITPGTLSLATAGAASVVTIPDPLTGDRLLVGTVLNTGPHLARMRRFAPFSLVPTHLGVVVDPLADQVALRTGPTGYVIESDSPAVALALLPPPAEASLIDIARLSRSFDLPDEAPPALLRRMEAQIADAAITPTRARRPFRLAVAQTMLALGLGVEAQGVLDLAAQDDPDALTDPTSQTLAAAAALIAGRIAQTGALEQVAAPETDEHRLWRALRAATLLPDGRAPAARTTADLVATADLLLAYPPTLRRCLLPLAADTLLRGGALMAAGRLLDALPADHDLDLARAAALQAQGRTGEALAAFDLLGLSRDRSVRARALLAALDLRVATGALRPAAAAVAGLRLTDAWRGDARERDVWLRVAAWEGKAGEYRQQLETLRDGMANFPAPQDGMHDRLVSAFTAIVRQSDGKNLTGLTPLDLVSLVRQNADLMPQGPAGETVAGELADRLTALDLPQQSASVLNELMAKAAAPAARAELGARLAALQLDNGEKLQALQTLTQSAAGDAPVSAGLAERRGLLAARANAGLGNRPAALANLANLADPPALLARAQVHEEAHDWMAAAGDLGTLASGLPSTGALDDAQSALVLRLASALAQAGDEPGLARARVAYIGRLPRADDAALLSVLTEAPVREVTDLPRAAAETAAARALSR